MIVALIARTEEYHIFLFSYYYFLYFLSFFSVYCLKSNHIWRFNCNYWFGCTYGCELVCLCVFAFAFALQAPNTNVFNSIPLHINITSSSMQYSRMERIHASSCKVNKDVAFLRRCETTLIFLRNPRFANIWYASFMR